MMLARERGTHPFHHLWIALRWVMLACALVAVGVATLVPRFVSTGHAAPNPAAAATSPKTTVFTLSSPDFEANGPLPASAAFNQAGCVGRNGAGQNIPPTLTWVNGQTGFTGFPTLSYALTT